jgi:hypothetical protein
MAYPKNIILKTIYCCDGRLAARGLAGKSQRELSASHESHIPPGYVRCGVLF